MTVIVIMSIVFTAISSLFIRSLRDYGDAARRSTAHLEAAQAVRLMQADVRGALRVSSGQADALTVVMPRVYWDAARSEYVPYDPPEDGEAISYYRGTDGGTPHSLGPYLWRARRPSGGGGFTPETRALAAHIEDVDLTYEHLPPPNQTTVSAVTARVVAGETIGAEHVSKAHTVRMTLRNVVAEH
jgi:hypothetical protein